MLIDVGAGAIDRGDAWSISWITYICKDNPANASGTITSVEIWANTDLGSCKVGIFYKTNGDTLKCRSAATIGDVTAGSKQTFPLDPALAVEAGDYIGIYALSGSLEADGSGFGGTWWLLYDHCIVDDEDTYDTYADTAVSLYGTGAEPVVGWTGKISGVTDPAKVMGVEVANIAKVKGVE